MITSTASFSPKLKLSILHLSSPQISPENIFTHLALHRNSLGKVLKTPHAMAAIKSTNFQNLEETQIKEESRPILFSASPSYTACL